LAKPGQVVIGPATASRLGEGATIEWLGETVVKGKADPLRPGVLASLTDV
jgi:class 3 adenylate cyclase